MIIPSNSSRRLSVVVRAIRASSKDAQIIVVDDGLDEVPNVENLAVLPGRKPFVFARNVNIGVRHALRDWPDVSGIVLLNDDAVIQSGSLELLARTGIENGAAAVVPACDHAHPAQALPRGGPRWLEHAVPFVCVWIARWAWERVGELDERFTAYGWEDNDWLYRARLAGLKWMIEPRVFVRHRVLPSAFRGRPGAHRDITEGARIFRDKWGRLWS